MFDLRLTTWEKQFVELKHSKWDVKSSSIVKSTLTKRLGSAIRPSWSMLAYGKRAVCSADIACATMLQEM
jgi:hypothetical protein